MKYFSLLKQHKMKNPLVKYKDTKSLYQQWEETSTNSNWLIQLKVQRVLIICFLSFTTVCLYVCVCMLHNGVDEYQCRPAPPYHLHPGLRPAGLQLFDVKQTRGRIQRHQISVSLPAAQTDSNCTVLQEKYNVMHDWFWVQDIYL